VDGHLKTGPLYACALEQNRKFVRCEINEARAARWHIVITEPAGRNRVHASCSPGDQLRVWNEHASWRVGGSMRRARKRVSCRHRLDANALDMALKENRK
jgi:hypothetical protein